MHRQCVKCQARCCRYFCLQIDTPGTYEQFEQVRWYLVHEAVSVHVDPEGDWWMLIDNPCRWLTGSSDRPRCARYRDRPLICRRFSPDRCDFTLGPYPRQMEFRSPAELEAYARQTLGPDRFRAARDGARTGKKPRGRRQG